MAIDLLATSVPFYFLRGASAHHKANAPKGSIANRSVIEDLPIQIVTSVLGAGIYSSVVLAGYVTFLPTLLILHFENLPSLVAAYDTQFFVLILSFLPVGIATKVFLFTPTAAARRDVTDAVNAQFDAETATLAETIWYNVWGYSKRVRVLILRTLIMAGMSGVSTITRSFASIEGVELVGAIGWTLPWVVSALFTGAAYGWVTGTEVLA